MTLSAKAPVATRDWLLDDTLAPDAADESMYEFYAAAARGELILPFCAGCQSALDLEQAVCDQCGSFDSDWRTVDLVGTVHSATTMHRFEPGLVKAQRPYPILDIELTSGHRLIMTTLDPTSTTPRIGNEVGIAFRNLGGVAIPAAYSTVQNTAPNETEARP